MKKVHKKLSSLDVSLENGKIDSQPILETEFCALAQSNIATIASFVRCARSKKRRSGAKVKAMSEISGTTAKPWKQKGTGRARQGSRRSVQFVGGRTCHGPSQANYYYSLPKNIVRDSVKISIISKIIYDKLVLIKSDITSHKSMNLARILTSNGIKSALIVSDSKKIRIAASNIKNIRVNSARSIRPLEVISHDFLLVDANIFIEKIQPIIS